MFSPPRKVNILRVYYASKTEAAELGRAKEAQPGEPAQRKILDHKNAALFTITVAKTTRLAIFSVGCPPEIFIVRRHFRTVDIFHFSFYHN